MNTSDKLIVWGSALGIIILASIYGEYKFGIPFLESMKSSFIGVGIGTIGGNIIFGFYDFIKEVIHA